MIDLSKFVRSLKFAIKGIVHVFKTEQNFRIQIIAAALIAILMVFFKTSFIETVVLITMITIVFIVEFINTVFERVVDVLKPRLHPYAMIIKDIMAGSVLLASLAALIIGLLIFLPKISDRFLT
ncbi:MAG: Diacylglycerol kinase [uncultured bacterium]|nr:MAG: Diacylglycerol kinase [uncultured bacterium]